MNVGTWRQTTLRTRQRCRFAQETLLAGTRVWMRIEGDKWVFECDACRREGERAEQAHRQRQQAQQVTLPQ